MRDFVADCLNYHGDGSSRDHDNAQMVAAALDMLVALKIAQELAKQFCYVCDGILQCRIHAGFFQALANVPSYYSPPSAKAEGHAHPTSPEPGDNPALG